MSSSEQIKKFKRSRIWKGFEIFTTTDLASICDISTTRARQVVSDMSDIIDKYAHVSGGVLSTRYKRKADHILSERWDKTFRSEGS